MKEETHTACKKRLKKEGEKTQCCYCVPHTGCEYWKLVKLYRKPLDKQIIEE